MGSLCENIASETIPASQPTASLLGKPNHHVHQAYTDLSLHAFTRYIGQCTYVSGDCSLNTIHSDLTKSTGNFIPCYWLKPCQLLGTVKLYRRLVAGRLEKPCLLQLHNKCIHYTEQVPNNVVDMMENKLRITK